LEVYNLGLEVGDWVALAQKERARCPTDSGTNNGVYLSGLVTSF